ncbi:MAG: hypothetical protein GX610_24685 [Rhodococcus sp.]|nr:hypothetical protein [Rhodococcus sp. (in: high G+C Gram-positive bacteria)]
MNRFQSAAVGLYATAAVAQALTWSGLSADERGSRIVAILLVGALLFAIVGITGERRG